jgi:hypothetical protein
MTLNVLNNKDEIEFSIAPDGTITGWACDFNDLEIAKVKLRERAAPRGECPHGFDKSFGCRD